MGERRGGNIAGHNRLDERWGRRVLHVDFFTRGGVVGPPEGEGESSRHIFSHMERKIFGDERASCRYGERCIISHLACRARYSLKSLRTYTPHTCSYFKVH